LLGQVGTDMNDVVGDHPESDPAPDAVWSFVGRSAQPMPSFENTDAALTAGTPFLKLLEPALLLPLLARLALGPKAGNGNALHPQFLGLGFVGGGKESRIGRCRPWGVTK